MASNVSMHTLLCILLSMTLSHYYRRTYSVSQSNKESPINKQVQLKLTTQFYEKVYDGECDYEPIGHRNNATFSRPDSHLIQICQNAL